MCMREKVCARECVSVSLWVSVRQDPIQFVMCRRSEKKKVVAAGAAHTAAVKNQLHYSVQVHFP